MRFLVMRVRGCFELVPHEICFAGRICKHIEQVQVVQRALGRKGTDIAYIYVYVYMSSVYVHICPYMPICSTCTTCRNRSIKAKEESTAAQSARGREAEEDEDEEEVDEIGRVAFPATLARLFSFATALLRDCFSSSARCADGEKVLEEGEVDEQGTTAYALFFQNRPKNSAFCMGQMSCSKRSGIAPRAGELCICYKNI